VESVWHPPDQLVAEANVTTFMARHALGSPAELLGRCPDGDWFWDVATADLGVEFLRPYTRVRDDGEGVEWTRWYLDGATNIAWNCLDRWSERDPDRLALRAEDEAGSRRQLTYADLRFLTDGLAADLAENGVGPRDVVAMFLPMVPEAVATLFACAKLGAICVPLFTGFGPDAMSARLRDAGAKVVTTLDATSRAGKHYNLAGIAARAVGQLDAAPRVLVIPQSGGRASHRAAERLASPALTSDHPFLLAYTSGTTGRPKGAVLGHAGVLTGIGRDAYFHMDVHGDDVLLWTTDMGWIMGPWAVVAAGLNGACLALYDGAPAYPDADRLWRVAEGLGVTILGTSPSLVRGLAGTGSDPGHSDLSGLRVLGGTGEPWDEAAWRWLLERVGGGRAPVINFSGGTEVGCALLAPLPVSPLKPRTLGGPAVGMDVAIVGPDGAPV
jgi:acetyl-CoA synthetase